MFNIVLTKNIITQSNYNILKFYALLQNILTSILLLPHNFYHSDMCSPVITSTVDWLDLSFNFYEAKTKPHHISF